MGNGKGGPGPPFFVLPAASRDPDDLATDADADAARAGTRRTGLSHGDPSIPPRVDYELTALGHSLRGPVCALSQWAVANIDAIQGAQGVFDGAGVVERAA